LFKYIRCNSQERITSYWASKSSEVLFLLSYSRVDSLDLCNYCLRVADDIA